MLSLVSELNRYATANPEYSNFHHGCNCQALRNFLSSTMDEVRLRHAEDYAESVLRVTCMQDASFFRKSLLRREASGEFSYPKQRDHAAHTLYNYIIGWYIYSNSPLVGDEVARHMKARGHSGDATDFGNTWPFLSLLHDVGYLFEGALAPLSTSVHSDHTNIGVDIANEYFHSEFWSVNCLDSVFDRQVLQRMIGRSYFQPDFSRHSLAQVADALRYLGHLEALRVQLLGKLKSGTSTIDEAHKALEMLERENGLPGDAFDLWEMHYNLFGNKTMSMHIQSLRTGFYNLLRFGRSDMGIRHLDHGVCSGLISLLYSTLYFEIYSALDVCTAKTPSESRVYNNFRVKAMEGADVDVDPLWWWTNVLWATAGAAMHNMQQIRHVLGADVLLPKIRLSDDPLAYLGILADIVQDWDRYGVSGVSSLIGALPVQGKDVKLGATRGKIVIQYSDKEKAGALVKDLNCALDGWEDIVRLK